MSAPRKVYDMHADKLTSGAKTALLIPRTPTDAYRPQPDADWHPVGGVAIGAAVSAVQHMGRYQTALGDVLAVYDDGTWQFAAHARVTGILAVQNADLSAGQVQALGFSGLDAFHAHDTAAKGSGWLMTVEPIDEEPTS